MEESLSTTIDFLNDKSISDAEKVHLLFGERNLMEFPQKFLDYMVAVWEDYPNVHVIKRRMIDILRNKSWADFED